MALAWVEAEDEPTGFPAAPGGSIASAPTRSANAFGADWRPQDFDRAGLFGGNQFAPFMGQPSEASETQPWWSRLPVQSEGSDDHPASRWSWLRAEPEDEPPGFRLNPDGSINQSEPYGNVRLMAGAYDPSVRDATAAANNGTESPIEVPPSPADGSQQSPVVGGTTATAVSVPAWGTAGSQTIRTALAELATLLGRGAAALPRISPASLALSFLVPTNTPSESIDLGNGLRARIRPGQRTVEIERQADNGPFGSSFGARWETLPINAELSVGADGAPSVLIDRRQLEHAVGPEAAVQALDAIGSAMARPPKKRKEDEAQPSGTEIKPGQPPNPSGGGKPPLGPGPFTTAAEVASQVAEHANNPRSDDQEQAELIEGWRQILKARGENAPDGQYRGEGGYMTALGVRMPPDVGDPAAGREAYPEQEHLRKALIGEFELVNRIRTVRPDEIIVHFGNAPGAQGPDVLSIGRDRLINAWDSKSRSGERSVGPSMVASAKLDRRKIESYVWKAVSEGRLSRDIALEALKKFYDGNYNILTVGTGNAHDGLVESFRKRKSNGPRRH
jgi:hypothetical protein